MMGADVTFLAAFSAGVLSFFSPCVVPLVPAYFAMLASFASETALLNNRFRYMAVWLAFFSGFSLTFVLMGFTASLVGRWLSLNQFVLQRLAAALFILMGLFMLSERAGSVIRERRWRTKTKRTGLVGAFFMGFGFAFGWSPCTGPILASLLAYAGLAQQWERAAFLLAAYSLGLAAPFAILTIIGNHTLFRRPGLLRIYPALHKTAGATLVLLGALLWFDWLNRLIAWLSF